MKELDECTVNNISNSLKEKLEEFSDLHNKKEVVSRGELNSARMLGVVFLFSPRRLRKFGLTAEKRIRDHIIIFLALIHHVPYLHRSEAQKTKVHASFAL